MGRATAILLTAAALATLGSGAVAQDSAAEAEPAIDSDLRCAIWSAALLDLVGQTDSRIGVTAAFTYFTGLYEGRTGESLGEAMTPGLVQREIADMQALTQLCQPRMAELGDRLDMLGSTLAKARPASEESSKSGSE